MKSIVVPVNYTKNAANAARYAADLALSLGADIHLVYVFEIPLTLSEAPLPPGAFEELELGKVTLLRDLKRELTARTTEPLNITTTIEVGNVETQLEVFCKTKDPFLVVMGASGNGIDNIFAGSNTILAVRQLPYPVLVVPEKASFNSIGKIVVACDREDILTGLPSALPYLKELGRHLPGTRVEILHVITDKEESTTELEEAYNSWKGEVSSLLPILHFIRRSKVENGIDDYLKGCVAGLVMVFPKNHGPLEFHKSQARKVVLHCALPVMSVHER
ncbi:universal stress protein [Puia dinghuensis]|uniref:UspA domain-containing protein n=1 Tax=Puia dinghuensis TaxID=1792502 RepID=A0A8J2UC06_9BACT|nr:universal stress protein [Puia dinghuensis]GGA94449.1 hypothetical protein GCM10011511_17180 [Puia dinghuensis]